MWDDLLFTLRMDIHVHTLNEIVFLDSINYFHNSFLLCLSMTELLLWYGNFIVRELFAWFDRLDKTFKEEWWNFLYILRYIEPPHDFCMWISHEEFFRSFHVTNLTWNSRLMALCIRLFKMPNYRVCSFKFYLKIWSEKIHRNFI